MKLPLSYYLGDDVLPIARDLLGKELFCLADGELCSGIICETEAYKGINDKASHAFGGKMTARNTPMFEQGGIAYVYLCYGIHNLFNIVTNNQGFPDAVLIRGIIPARNAEVMKKRAHAKKFIFNGIGPGKVSTLLGINRDYNRADLCGDEIYLVDCGLIPSPDMIENSPRIGVAYAGDDAKLPYRFNINKKYHEQLLSTYYSSNR